MAAELVLKDACSGCGATLDLYGSGCRHLTLCAKCGKTMAETAAPCSDCGVPVTRLIRVRFLYPCTRFVCSPVSRATHVFLPASLKLGSGLKFLLLLSVSLTKVCNNQDQERLGFEASFSLSVSLCVLLKFARR